MIVEIPNIDLTFPGVWIKTAQKGMVFKKGGGKLYPTSLPPVIWPDMTDRPTFTKKGAMEYEIWCLMSPSLCVYVIIYLLTINPQQLFVYPA